MKNAVRTEEEKTARRVRSLMADLTGDDRWLHVEWRNIPISRGNPEEIVDWMLSQSYGPEHCGWTDPENPEDLLY